MLFEIKSTLPKMYNIAICICSAWNWSKRKRHEPTKMIELACGSEWNGGEEKKKHRQQTYNSFCLPKCQSGFYPTQKVLKSCKVVIQLYKWLITPHRYNQLNAISLCVYICSCTPCTCLKRSTFFFIHSIHSLRFFSSPS